MYNDFHDLHREIWPVPSMAQVDTGQTLTSPNWTLIIWNIVVWNPAGAYDNTTGLYTCQHAGLYRCTASLLLGGNSAFRVRDVYVMAFYVNGVVRVMPNRQDDWGMCTGNIYPFMHGTAVVRCNKGDTIGAWFKQNTGTVRATYTGAYYNYFQVERVGPYYP